MKQLIERLEKATGPDRELDCLIAIEANDRPSVYLGDRRALVFDKEARVVRIGDGGPSFDPRFYTSSIDAALTLVPPDIWWILAAGRTRPNEPLYAVQLRKAGAQIDDPPLTEAEHDANAAIPICIAALEVMDSHSHAHPTRTNT